MDRRFLTEIGIIGALTDNVYLTGSYSYYVDAADEALDVGEALDLTQTVLRVDPLCNGEVKCGFVQLSGPVLTDSGNGYTLSEPGVVTLVYYADTTGGNASYRVYSVPVTVTFGDVTAVTGVTLDKTTAALKVGETVTLTATVAPAEAADKTVTWTSSDTSVATVVDGVVTAVGAGTATITVTTVNGGKTATCAVTVTAAEDSGSDTPIIYPTYPSVTTYPVKAGDTNSINGSVAISSASAMAGSTVTVTVDPDAGYMLGALSVTTTNGVSIALTSKGGGVYTFIMPAGAVTVSAYFQAAAACDGGMNCPAGQFSDISTTAWYHEYVDYAVAEGLMGSSGNGKFDPNGTMTRAMVWTVLGRQSGADVDGGSPWYGKAQTWSMTAGVSDGSDPNGSITREQLVTMLYRFVGSPQVGISELGMLSSFDDGGSISPYAQQAMAWAVGNGIIEGSGNKLDPQSNATRAQFAAILMRFCQL